ncbi:MAG TPA: alpha/beta hydrolase [Dehalococcoidia bacterium]|nr:alpha/beta hydrolase [Dehalococcoidia bacterium]
MALGHGHRVSHKLKKVSDMKDVTSQPRTIFQEGWVEADGLRLKYRSNYPEGGQGHPVVILDGPTWGSRRLPDVLAQQGRVIALELPGFGTSTADTGSRSVQDIANTTTRALARIAPDQYTLIGTSFGANVALWQTLQAPDSVEALILISPTGLLPTGGPADVTPGELAGRLFAHPENAPGLSSASDAAFDAPSLARELSLAQRLGGNAHDTAAEQRLSEIQCATLVVFGSRDQLVSPRAGSIYRANIPNCNVSIVYDAGHGIAAERPEALWSTVVDFVERRETFVVGHRSSLVNP